MFAPQTKPDPPHTTYTACVAVDLTARCTTPRPVWSHDPGQTLWCHPAVYPLCAGGPGVYRAMVYSLCGGSQSCLTNPKFLSESVQPHFFPLLRPEHTFTTWKGVVSAQTDVLYNTCLRRLRPHKAHLLYDILFTVMQWMHIPHTLQQWL